MSVKMGVTRCVFLIGERMHHSADSEVGSLFAHHPRDPHVADPARAEQ